jgi:putative FmdB family regulatory protein
MPIYEYQCAACGRIVEKWQNISEEPLTVCPHCGGRLSKIISSCTFQLKGSGWYVSDYGGSHAGSTKTENTGEDKEARGGEESTKPEKSDSSPPPKLK